MLLFFNIIILSQFASQMLSLLYANLYLAWLWIYRAWVLILGPVFQQQRCFVNTESRAAHGYPEMVPDTSGIWHCQPALHCRGPGESHVSPRSGSRGRYSTFTQLEWDQDHPTCPQVIFYFNASCPDSNKLQIKSLLGFQWIWLIHGHFKDILLTFFLRSFLQVSCW